MGNIIRLNSVKLNTEVIGCAGACDDMLHRAPSIPTTPPEFPELPEFPEPDVPTGPTTYTLVAEVANGVVSAKLNGVAVQLPYTATEGDVIVLEVTPAEGYEFVSWADGNTENPRAISMLSNVTLSASCEVVTPSNPDVDENGYIIFEDAEVARICAENWGDGTGITLEQAAAVTSVGTVFKGNTAITSFNEFGKFTNVQIIPMYAFEKCTALHAIDFPESVTTVGARAFFGCAALQSVINLPNLESIAELVFYGSGITSVANLGRIAKLSDGDNNNSLGVFSNCPNLSSVRLPETLTYIGSYAFYNSVINDINIPSGVVTIGKGAFRGVPAQIDVDYPKLEQLGQAAFYNSGVKRILNLGTVSALLGKNSYNSFGDFYGCVSLELAILPATMTSIAAYSLRDCPILNTVVCKATTPPTLGSAAFSGTLIASGTGSIYVPDASVAAYREASVWSSYASRIFPILQLQTDNPELFTEIQEYL